MDLPRFVALVKARRRLIGGIVAVAVLLTLVGSLAQPSRYEAVAELLFGRTTNADAIIAGGSLDTGQVPERAAATNLALASLDSVAARVERSFRGDATVDDLRDAVSIEAEGESDVVTVTARWGTPRQAAAIANAFATQIVELRREAARTDLQRAIDALQASLPPEPSRDATPGAAPDARTTALRDRISQLEVLRELQTGNVQLVERATPPQERSSPRPLRNALVAAVVALVLALFLVVLLARFGDHIGDEDEVAALMGAPILTRIPKVARSRPLAQMWSPEHNPAFVEAFEFLRLNLETMGGPDGSLVVAVTSPAAADGKTTTVAWLARSLALSGAEVVAVDLDLRKPELHAYFDAPREPGSGVLEALAESGNGHAAGWPLHEAGRPDAQDRQAEGAAQGRRAYTEEDVTVGLTELARFRGNARRAARALREAGRDMSESTLRRWKDLHAPLYAELRAAHMQGLVVGPRLRLLTGGSFPEPPTGLIARGRLRPLFEQLREDADYVVVDTVPVSTVADASAVAAAADGVILVIDLERVRRRDLVAAKKQLHNARATLLGIALNRAPAPPVGHYGHEDDRDRERPPAHELGATHP